MRAACAPHARMAKAPAPAPQPPPTKIDPQTPTRARRARRPLLGLVNVDQQRVEVEGVWQDVVADVVAAHGELVDRDGVLALGQQLRGGVMWKRRERVAGRVPFRDRCLLQRRNWGQRAAAAPVMVPWITVPFLSSICTVSFESFMRNLKGWGRGGRGEGSEWNAGCDSGAGGGAALRGAACVSTSSKPSSATRAATHLTSFTMAPPAAAGEALGCACVALQHLPRCRCLLLAGSTKAAAD